MPLLKGEVIRKVTITEPEENGGHIQKVPSIEFSGGSQRPSARNNEKTINVVEDI
jgi:hypothetical protein